MLLKKVPCWQIQVGVSDSLHMHCYLRGEKTFKYREIAEKLGLPLGTVKSRIFFTRQRLQGQLRDFV